MSLFDMPESENYPASTGAANVTTSCETCGKLRSLADMRFAIGPSEERCILQGHVVKVERL